MSDIVKKCIIHGNLKKEQVTGKRQRCKYCVNERAKKYRTEKKDEYLRYMREWRKKRKENGLIISKPKKERRYYDPNAEGNIWECKVHGWLKKDGLYFKKKGDLYIQASCIECMKQRMKKMYENDPEKIKERQRKYRKENNDHYKEKYKEYYYRDIQKTRLKAKNNYRKNKQKISERAKLYREKNKEKIYERNRIYVESNSEKVRERQRKYLERRRDYFRQKRNEWKKRTSYDLSDSYIRGVIVKKKGLLRPSEIPDEVIELKRVLLKIHRKRRQMIKESGHEKNSQNQES